MMNQGNPTIQDVAKQAGVSKATVSLVLNGSPKISAPTCDKVLAAIRSLNFQPSEDARKLAQRRWPTSTQAAS